MTGQPVIVRRLSALMVIKGDCREILAGVIMIVLAPQVIVTFVPTVVACARPIVLD